MNFKNAAFLFDSTILGDELNSLVRGAISFIGNPLYISAYAKEAVDRFAFSTVDEKNLKEWLRNIKNEDEFARFLIKLYEDANRLGLSSFFIEKDYSAFIYLIGLMGEFSVNGSDFRKIIDNLYYAYKAEYNESIIRNNNNIEEIVTVFNERIKHIMTRVQKGQYIFQNLFKESNRSLDEQIAIVHLLNNDWKQDYLLADYFYYSKQIFAYRENEIHEVYANKKAACRLEEETKRMCKSADVELCISEPEDDFFNVTLFARMLMLCSHYFLEEIIEKKDIELIPEDDKYFFVITWMILQSGDNNMFINGRSYEQIRELFLSLKKDMNI